jgi:hypothetical protein
MPLKGRHMLLWAVGLLFEFLTLSKASFQAHFLKLFLIDCGSIVIGTGDSRYW